MQITEPAFPDGPRLDDEGPFPLVGAAVDLTLENLVPVQRLARHFHHLFPQTLGLRGSVIHPQQAFPPRIDLHDPFSQPAKEKACLLYTSPSPRDCS